VGRVRTICYYAVATHLGGGERSLLDLLRGLKKKPELGYNPWVLLPKADGPLVEHLVSIGVDYDVLPLPKAFFEMSRGAPLVAFQQGLKSVPGMGIYLTKLILLLRRKKPALIHTNAIKCHALAAVVGPSSGVPVLWHLRDILPNGPTLWTLRALQRASQVRVIANSRATADSYLKDAQIARGIQIPRFLKEVEVPIVYNGLDPEKFQRLPNRKFHELFKVPNETPMVGILGVLARWKGHVEFIEMAARLIRSGSQARFVIIGDEIYDTVGENGYGSQLRDQVRKLGIQDRVLFTGFTHDPAEAINGLDILVHASIKPEPFGRVVIEALACGVAVVACAAGGVLEIIQDKECGLLYTPGDVEEMAEKVALLEADLSERMKLAENGRMRFLEKFTFDRYTQAVAQQYDKF